MSKYVVVRDTREKDGQGWSWNKSKYCGGTVTRKLDTGDYTIEVDGNCMSDFISIERKGSVSEWAKNLTEARFERELERLEEIDYPWIILEFNMSDILNYPVGSGIPRYKWKYLKFKGPFILKRMTEIMIKYRTQIVLCGENGKEVASNIFKRTIERCQTQ